MDTSATQAVMEKESFSPPDIVGLVQEGKQALERGDLDKALELFESVIHSFPERPEGHNNLGALYTSLGRFAQAERSFGQVLRILPDNTNVHYNRGIVRIRLQKYGEAIADFNTVLAKQPDDADCWNNLGVATFLKQDLPSARSHFLQALKLAPQFPNAVLNLVDTELAGGDRGAAVAVCEDYLSRDPHAEVRYKLLDLLVAESRDVIARACATATNLEATAGNDEQIRDLHQRLVQAQTLLAEDELAV